MGRAFYLEVNSMDCIDDTSPARSGQRFALESDLQGTELLDSAFRSIHGGFKRWDLSQDPLQSDKGDADDHHG